jgi:hypothetical protein
VREAFFGHGLGFRGGFVELVEDDEVSRRSLQADLGHHAAKVQVGIGDLLQAHRVGV